MYCKYCGSEIEPTQKYCAKCGARLNTEPSQHARAEEVHVETKRSSSQRRKPLAIGISAMVIAIAICGLVIANPFKGDEPNNDSSNQTPTGFHYSEELFFDEPDDDHFAEDAETGLNFIDNEIILYCENGKLIDEILLAGEVSDYEIAGHVEATNSYQVRLAQKSSYAEIKNVCSKLLEVDGVEECLPHYAMTAEPTKITSDPAWTEEGEKGKPSKTWGLESIKAPEAWDSVEASSSVHVGMLEHSQFYVYHEDLEGAIAETLPSSDSQFDIKDGFGWFASEDAHGTHVAGIIGAESNDRGTVGVAHGASLYGYSCGGKDSSGNPKMTAEYGLEVGLAYLVAMHGCDVVNVSLKWNTDDDAQGRASKGNGSKAAAAQWEMQQYGAELAVSIKALIRGGHDFIICKSADNDGTKGLANWDLFGCIGEDEVASRILIVGSLAEGKNGQLEVSSFSSCGSRVDVLAPGSDIYSTIYRTTDEGGASIPYSDYGYMSGTSMAAPMAAGVAALVKAANPELSGKQIKDVICKTASGSYRDKTGVTRGQVNAERAVKEAASMKPLVVYLGDNHPGIEAVSEEFVKAWYNDWTFEDGEMRINQTPISERCLPYIAEGTELYSEFSDETNFYAGSGSRLSRGAALSVATIDATLRDGNTVTVDVAFYGAQNTITQEMFDQIKERPANRSTWTLTFDDNGKIIELENGVTAENSAEDKAAQYESTLNAYRSGLASDTQPPYDTVNPEAWVTREYNKGRYAYALYDINGDGSDELLIGLEESTPVSEEGLEVYYRLYDLFTLDNGKPVRVLGDDGMTSLGYRAFCVPCENNIIATGGSGGATYHVRAYWRLGEKANDMSLSERVTIDADEYTFEDSDGKSEVLSGAEARSRYEKDVMARYTPIARFVWHEL